MRLLSGEQAALDDFVAWVRARFGARLYRIALFGSRARGEGHEGSDLDVLVVADGLSGGEAREVWHAAGDALTNHDVRLSALPLSRARYDELLALERRIALEIEREGIVL